MNETNLNRRSVLKAMGTTGMLGTVGTASGFSTSNDSIQLIEMGLRYDLPSGHPYQQTHVDQLPTYTVRDDEAVTIRTQLPTEERRRLRESDVLVGGSGTNLHVPPSVAFETRGTTELTTGLTERYRPIQQVFLESAVRTPTVQLQLQNNRPIMSVNNEQKTLPSSSKATYSLEPVPVQVKTQRALPTRAEYADVPKHERGLKIEKGVVEVEARPILEVQNHGTVSIDFRAQS